MPRDERQVDLAVALRVPPEHAREVVDKDVVRGRLVRAVGGEVQSWSHEVLPIATLAGESARTGIAAIDKLLESMASAKVKGFPLKETTTIGTKGAAGDENSVTSTVEVHDVRRVATTPAQFVVPAGYKRIP